MKNKIVIWSSSIILSLIGSFIYDSIKEIPLFSSIWNTLKWIWKSIFEFELKVWEIIILISAIYFIKKIIDKNSKVTEIPKFLSYKKDKIHSFNWKWEWRFNQNLLKWNVTGLKPLCPKCETTMHYDYSSMNYGYTANCPRCHYQNNQIPNYNDIEALIIDNVDRGNYE